MANGRSRGVPLGLVLLRITTGGVLVRQGWRWLTSDPLEAGAVRASIERSLDSLASWLVWWGEHALLASPDATALFWRWGALLFGLCFVLGALTRPAGFLAGLFLAHGIAYGPRETELAAFLLLVLCFACALSGAGRRWGLDALFDQHFPSWITWSRRPSSGFLS